jgi:glycosyltransferase involved in cell wall biosynthesis
MRVAIVHGYFLHDSGSGIYVHELARALVLLGHEVTLVCQDRQPELCDFVDSAYVLDADNESLTRVYEVPRGLPGSCRLVRPDTAGDLLVYAEGDFPPFAPEHVHAYQDVTREIRERYIDRNVTALRTVFAQWPPDLVLAQHVIMQPYIVAKALEGRAPYVVTAHGSALNFSVRENEDLVPYAVEGLEGATRIAAVSEGACDDLIAWASEHSLSIAEKTRAIPPGINSHLFKPAAGREDALATLDSRVELPDGFALTAEDDIVAFASALRTTKGIQHAIAAMPIVSQLRGRPIRLLVAGGGPARSALERLAVLAEVGDAEAAKVLVEADPMLQSPAEWGEVVPSTPPVRDGVAIAFLGHLEHERLAAVFAATDACVSPSVFPEAAALVNVEALATGAIPVATYHSGMTELDDLLAKSLHDARFDGLVPGSDFTRRLAETIAHVLDTYPTKTPEFRRRMHRLAMSHYPAWEETAREYVAMAESDNAS